MTNDYQLALQPSVYCTSRSTASRYPGKSRSASADEIIRLPSSEPLTWQGDLSDKIKACLVMARLDQARQRFKKIAFAEIIKAAAPLDSLNQIDGRRSGKWNSCFFQQCAESIEEPNRQERTDLLESSSGAVHSIKHPIVPAVAFDSL